MPPAATFMDTTVGTPVRAAGGQRQ